MLTVKRNWPSWLISTQHGAVWLFGNGERADRGERAVGRDGERRDGAVAGAVVRVRDEELRRFGRAELATERAEALRCERRAGGSGEETVDADREAVDQRGVHARADELASRRR